MSAEPSHVLPFAEQRSLFGAASAAPSSPALTVRELCRQYLELKELEHRGGLLGDRLLERYRRYLGLFAEGPRGDLAADRLRPSDVTRWILGHEAWKAPATRVDAARSIQSAWQWAADEDLLQKNPIRKIKPCWETPRPRAAIRPEEYEAMMACAKRCNGRAGCPSQRARRSRSVFRRALFFLAQTGARTCEMRAARWADVDWEQGIIRLSKHKTRGKTGKPRVVPLSRRVVWLLRWMYRHRPAAPKAGAELIFVSSWGTAWTRRTFGRLFRKYARLAGVRNEVSAYSLRHGFCVAGLKNGVGAKQLAAILGHTTTRYVDWYGAEAGLDVDYLRATMERIHTPRPHAPPAKPG